MPSAKQDQDFASMMADEANVTVTLSKSALDIAIDYIQSNLNPDDVFSDKDLQAWAEANGYIKE